MPFPAGGLVAKRSGHFLCIADKELYHMVDLTGASTFPMVPISQAGDGKLMKPSITVISETEFLILSWTGQATIGIFITVEGDPVRGTLEWPTYPESITLDYPFIIAVLPNQTVDIHNIETQSLIQSILAPSSSPTSSPPITSDRKRVIWTAGGFLVPSSQGSSNLKMVPVPLIRKKKAPLAVEDESANEASTKELELMEETGKYEDVRDSATEDTKAADVVEDTPQNIVQ
ncbi:hypothetical protein EUX98_g3126 [Antrodiella citrinella]|uniref:CNH domain-containing protein n=1 Tax=Antrodiella citrinella TaxID=2447956 RepID=A0A4V3XIZ1_9APHY|nr:hypothetical protein EUX98_g3126 [Antrodiella citrinella]